MIKLLLGNINIKNIRIRPGIPTPLLEIPKPAAPKYNCPNIVLASSKVQNMQIKQVEQMLLTAVDLKVDKWKYIILTICLNKLLNQCSSINHNHFLLIALKAFLKSMTLAGL